LEGSPGSPAAGCGIDRQASHAAGREGRTIPAQHSCPAPGSLRCALLFRPSPRPLAGLGLREMPDRDDIGSFCAEDRVGPDFDLLYRNHAPALRRRLRARVRSHEEANDLVQDAFARLLGARSLSSVRDPCAFLNRIVRNLLIDRSRRLSARFPHVSIDVDADIAVAPDQGQEIEVEQMRQRYRELVQLLPPRTREVFILHRLDGHSYKDIAARLDISVRTVEWHIAQAIVRISRGLDGE